MFIEEPPNDGTLKSEILNDLCYKVSSRIATDNSYCTFLMNNEPLHEKLVLTLNDAIAIHENEEKYEVCAVLLTFKNEILNKNCN